jgi:hypothetical protein
MSRPRRDREGENRTAQHVYRTDRVRRAMRHLREPAYSHGATGLSEHRRQEEAEWADLCGPVSVTETLSPGQRARNVAAYRQRQEERHQ